VSAQWGERRMRLDWLAALAAWLPVLLHPASSSLHIQLNILILGLLFLFEIQLERQWTTHRDGTGAAIAKGKEIGSRLRSLSAAAATVLLLAPRLQGVSGRR